ncbi:hypothetical protein HYQ45_011518 [Verticillium longisporum]|uniref:Uncharacterized protein n=1 Tax=Verticillium longisporum TaxID=100787 RepID=A0A0G4M8K5_VERLO|nr:hypothetical protein HYQ44_011916 [Verticillium longisporum]KAG7129217.1 hypothetical protein HYQ45_011518 [Verticillium longisporum]CRK28713.1 hypothetical protein BN1723_014182 [Verticillium longisporum]CRK30613.1 hypothetical protein BN1708_015803 [Verticillium longisporum]
MCRVTLFNIRLCPCKDITCALVRPFELDAAQTAKFPARAHIHSADEVVLPEGLPCAGFFDAGHFDVLVASGGGDLALAQSARPPTEQMIRARLEEKTRWERTREEAQAKKTEAAKERAQQKAKRAKDQ